MVVKFETVVVDSVNPRLVADFWSQVLDWHIVDVDDHGAIEIRPRDQRNLSLLFEPSTRPKVTKSRIHFIPRQNEQETELQRLLDLGARQVDVRQGDVSWIVLADPEGNEFCLLRQTVDEPHQNG